MEIDFLVLSLKILTLGLCVLLSAFNQSETECVGQTYLPQADRRWMSTKTGYRQVVKTLSPASPSDVAVTGCKPVHLWIVVRHGTRYPSKKAIKLMKEDLPQLRDKILNSDNGLCHDDKEVLQNWNVDVNPDVSKNLHTEGDEEMILLGERWLQRLPDLLSNYEETMFRLRSTDTERSRRSGLGFVTGLWTRVISQHAAWYVEPGHDPLIRFYKLCQSWIKHVKKNSAANVEKDLFESSSVMTEVISDMSQFVGVNLTMSDLDMMYVMCNFDVAWSPDNVSPWCRMFTDHALRVMEYREDLEYYWIDGPGHNVTSDQACVLMEDMIKTFDNVIKGQVTNGTFYFTHSGTILKLLAYLGVFNDNVPLTSDNFHLMQDRKWKTSHIGPFGANIAFVLQECLDEEYKVGLFVNERLVTLPGCDQWCSIDKLKILFKHLESCDFHRICDDDSNVKHDVPDDKY